MNGRIYNTDIGNNEWFLKISGIKHEIDSIFKAAGIESPSFAFVEPIGYGQTRSEMVDVFENPECNRNDVVSLMFKAFHRAKGVFKTRCIEAFNPFYWLQEIIFLPSNILKYLGVSSETLLGRFMNFSLWIFAAITFFYSDAFDSFIKIFNK